ncbi:M24 family metallopeptidase [Niameybacter massiliensis]|uniref:M24 family metallopeptidase n=1 Tax=Holtiella tumoricola TaxID=3018743 RepID=A0AA42J0U4_9FIRM|nr:M24 family metallopeptidase [Holtiella tumoricola]MDA3731750.1 M24 family metallopeptidase [Holtiella tumoricola]
MDIQKIQQLLEKYKMDYWIITDYHGRDVFSQQLLDLPQPFFTSRRWIYLLPRIGQPIKLVSTIEKHILDILEGTTVCYTSYESLKTLLHEYLYDQKVAMQYSKECQLPIVATTDAGFVELIKSIGGQAVSSGDLIQELYCVLDEEGIESHKRAGEKILRIRDDVYQAIRKGINEGQPLTEWDVLVWIQKAYEKYNLTCDHDMPYVAVNEHASQLTFVPTSENSYTLQEGDLLLLDLWAREKGAKSIYYDVTFCAYIGKEIPKDYAEQFEKVVGAREACLTFIQERLEKGLLPKGYEVDQHCRKYFEQCGEADYFIHRTGHNIGHEVHGPGANLDSFEAIDDRKLLPGTLFSIEPGLYKKNIGVRTEVDVYIDDHYKLHVFGEKQFNLFKI